MKWTSLEVPINRDENNLIISYGKEYLISECRVSRKDREEIRRVLSGVYVKWKSYRWASWEKYGKQHYLVWPLNRYKLKAGGADSGKYQCFYMTKAKEQEKPELRECRHYKAKKSARNYGYRKYMSSINLSLDDIEWLRRLYDAYLESQRVSRIIMGPKRPESAITTHALAGTMEDLI